DAMADGELRARSALDLAVADLTACIEYHAPPLGERHLLRELRARSERAAVRGFYASWRLVHARRSGSLAPSDVHAIVQVLKQAQDDLTAGMEMFPATEARVQLHDSQTGNKRLGKFFSM